MMEPHKTRVLVVEDSPVVQTLWVQLLQSDPRFEVVGRANNGEEAIALAATRRPDVILMDVYMPKMDGIEATRRIMESQPVPIVVASATRDSQEVPLAFAPWRPARWPSSTNRRALALPSSKSRPGS